MHQLYQLLFCVQDPESSRAQKGLLHMFTQMLKRLKMVLVLTMLLPRGRDQSFFLPSTEAKGKRVGGKRRNE